MKCPNCNLPKKHNKVSKDGFCVYICENCQNGFTYPIPKNLGDYYKNYYWNTPGLLGKLKNITFKVFQFRRVRWVKRQISKGSILDVGSGEGVFSKSFGSNFNVTNIEPVRSSVENGDVIKVDFLKWKTNKKYDCVCFWQSLEHLSYPKKYLQTASKLLKKGSKIYIEFPNYNSLESRIFGASWFHLDLPRHLNHFTKKGIENLLGSSGYKRVKTKGVFCFEYAPWGLVASCLNFFNIDITNQSKRSGNLVFVILIFPLLVITTVLEIVFTILGQSAIMLVEAQKA